MSDDTQRSLDEREALDGLLLTILYALEKCHEHVGTDLINEIWKRRNQWAEARDPAESDDGRRRWLDDGCPEPPEGLYLPGWRIGFQMDTIFTMVEHLAKRVKELRDVK